jgi:hypothetical protein
LKKRSTTTVSARSEAHTIIAKPSKRSIGILSVAAVAASAGSCAPFQPAVALERATMQLALMRDAENRENGESAATGAAPSARKISPLPALALGTAAYLLLAAVVDFGVVRVPDGNRVLHTALLTLLSLAFVALAEAFLAAIRAIAQVEMFGWPFCAAAAGSVAYSIGYGDRVFVNSWYWDDWGYLVPHPLDEAWLTGPLNDHFVPLLKIVLWGMRKVFGLDYIGAACLQQAAFLVIVVVLAHLLWRASERPWILVLWVGLFAAWPSYGPARTWFGGGFWLTASAALLAVYLLHARRIIVFAEAMRLTDAVVSALLAAATVFISSQTLAPAVYLIAFCAPVLLSPERRDVTARRLVTLGSVSLAPTALALWGRSVYVVRPPLNYSGLLNGRLFTNLAVFVLNKALFLRSFGWFFGPRAGRALGLACVLLVVGAARLAISKTMAASRRTHLASLILGGFSLLILPLAQIGLARRWNYGAALGDYYVTLPFLGFWLASAAIVLALVARLERSPKNPSERPPDGADWVGAAEADDSPRQAGRTARQTRAAGLAFTAVIAAAVLGRAHQPGELPLAQRLEIIRVQRQFLDRLGAAACSLAALHRDGRAVHWVPGYDISNCSVCADIIGPPQFVHDLGFDPLVRIAARRSCPAIERTGGLVASPGASSAPATDGTESEAARAFLRQYLAPDHSTITPP